MSTATKTAALRKQYLTLKGDALRLMPGIDFESAIRWVAFGDRKGAELSYSPDRWVEGAILVMEDYRQRIAKGDGRWCAECLSWTCPDGCCCGC